MNDLATIDTATEALQRSSDGMPSATRGGKVTASDEVDFGLSNLQVCGTWVEGSTFTWTHEGERHG
eukprot:5953970-Pyramimonas_sp.AAC.1